MNFSNRNNYHPNNDIFWFGNINNSNNLNNNNQASLNNNGNSHDNNFWRGNDANRYNGGNRNNNNNHHHHPCFICKKRGHSVRNCYFKKNNKKKRFNNNNNSKNNNSTHQQTNSNNKTQSTSIVENVENLNISDCGCPICLEILVEPVVLPCKHELCLPCFKGITEKNNTYTCPLCRVNFSTWAHSAKKQNLLVDKTRWKAIQQTFGTEIRNRVEGKTAMLLQDELRNVTSKPYQQVVSENGEIKKEFEELVKREEERLRIEKEKEEQLSLQYIQEIIQREEACTFSQYLNVIKAKEPVITTTKVPIVRNQHEPTTSSNSNTATTSVESTITVENQHQPFITPSIPVISKPNNRLLNKVKSNNTLENTTPVASSSSVDSTDSASSSNITPSYSLRTRSSMKRNIDEVKNIRANLLNTLTENKESSNEDSQPKSKRILKNTTNDSIIELSVNNSHLNDQDTDIIIDSKLPVTSAGLVRRRSVRVKKN